MATLKISDLSVGDWVGERCGTKIKAFKVAEIKFNKFIHKYVVILNNKVYGLPTTELHPIPITAEILEKNGFTRRNSEFPIYEYATLLGKMLRTTVVSLNHPSSYIVCRIEDTSKELHEYDRITVNSSVERTPIYIHDLQHALRLAGVDKEINL